MNAVKQAVVASVHEELAELAERMKTASGAELQRLQAEVDRVIGFSAGDYDPEVDADWQLANRNS